MKKKLFIALITGCCAIGLIACGKKTPTQEASQFYQEELGLDEESADELAELREEMMAELDEDGGDAEEAYDEQAIQKEINACFDDAFNNSVSPFDKAVFTMTEEEIVATYGTPSSYLENLEEFTYDIDDRKFKINCEDIESGSLNYYSEQTSDSPEFKRICKENAAIEFSAISDWYETGDGVLYFYSNPYEVSQMTTYDDFKEKFGNPGVVITCGSDLTNDKIDIEWYVPEGMQITISFDYVTGERIKMPDMLYAL